MIGSAAFWNRHATGYAARNFGNPAAYEATLSRVRAHLSPGDNVLELGCGTGTTALRLADTGARIEPWDHASAMIALAQAKPEAAAAADVTFHAGEIEAAIARGPFDAVLAFNLLHLLDDLDATLADIHGALRPGGLILSKTICKPDRGGPVLYHLLRACLPLLQRLGKAPAMRLRRVSALEAAVRHAGFEIIETGNYPDAPPRRFIVARKPG